MEMSGAKPPEGIPPLLPRSNSNQRTDRPSPTCDCASSFSWCGNTKSLPPPWTSITGPITSRIMELHSMCQPGRPGPQGESQDGSPGWGGGVRGGSMYGPSAAVCLTCNDDGHIDYKLQVHDSSGPAPGLAAFQSAKSAGLLLRPSTATRSPARLSSCCFVFDLSSGGGWLTH